MSDIKDNLEGCEICLRHVDVDTLVSMLDRKKFNIVAGGIADGDCGWESEIKCITVDDQWIHVKTTTFEFHICMVCMGG